MSNLIPTKIITDEGIIAIKNGIKPNKSNLVPVERKPSWLRVNLNTSSKFKELKKIVHQKKLNTVCEEAMCPTLMNVGITAQQLLCCSALFVPEHVNFVL